MPKNAQLVSRFSSDGEESHAGRPAAVAIDLPSRGALQPPALQDDATTEKENMVASGDEGSPRRRRKSSFIRRITSKLRPVPHPSNVPQSPPLVPQSPPHSSPLSPRILHPNGPHNTAQPHHNTAQPGHIPFFPSPGLLPDLSVQEKEQDRQLDAYFPRVSDATSLEEDDWMTEARQIREDLETRWHSDAAGMRKVPIYPEVLATPQFGNLKAKSATDLQAHEPAPHFQVVREFKVLRAHEPAPHFEVVREFTVLRPRCSSMIPPVETTVADVPKASAKISSGSLQPPSIRNRAHSLSPRTSRASLRPPGPPPDGPLPTLPPPKASITLAVPGPTSQPQPPVMMANGQLLRTSLSVSNLNDNRDTIQASPRSSETTSVPFPSNDSEIEAQDRLNAASPAPHTTATKGAVAEATADPRGRGLRRKSFVEHSLESLRRSFSKSKSAKPPPVPPKFDASQLPPVPPSKSIASQLPLPPPLPLSIPLSPTSGSFHSSSCRSSAASDLARSSGQS